MSFLIKLNDEEQHLSVISLQEVIEDFHSYSDIILKDKNENRFRIKSIVKEDNLDTVFYIEPEDDYWKTEDDYDS